MTPIKKKLAGKAVKTTAKHTAHGTASKLRREPLRAATLLCVGWAAGVLTGRLFAGPGDSLSPQASPSPQS